MFKNEHKQRMLEKVRNYFFESIFSKEDSALESVEREAIGLQTYASELEQICSSGKLKEFMLQYDGNFLEELHILEQAALRIRSKAFVSMVKMILKAIFSLFMVLIVALLIFLIPGPVFSTEPERFLPEDWQRDLQQRLDRLKKAERSVWFIRKKRVQHLLELFWAGIRIRWDNLWLSQNGNAK